MNDSTNQRQDELSKLTKDQLVDILLKKETASIYAQILDSGKLLIKYRHIDGKGQVIVQQATINKMKDSDNQFYDKLDFKATTYSSLDAYKKHQEEKAKDYKSTESKSSKKVRSVKDI